MSKIILLSSSSSSFLSCIILLISVYWFFLRKKHYYINNDKPTKQIEIDLKDVPEDDDMVLKNVKELYLLTSKIPKERKYIVAWKKQGEDVNKILKRDKEFYNPITKEKKTELFVDFTDPKNKLEIQDVLITKVV